MKELRVRAIRIAQSMLAGDLDVIKGCRLLSALSFDLDMEMDGDFLFFRGVASDTDAWPKADARELYSNAMLTKADVEMQAYLDDMGPTIMLVCREIIEKLEG